jgi:hypothetical protein
MPSPKFNIGDKVKLSSASDFETGAVVSFSYTKGDHLSETEKYRYFYTITSTELDYQKKEVINGVIHAWEDELELVPDKAKAAEVVPATE